MPALNGGPAVLPLRAIAYFAAAGACTVGSAAAGRLLYRRGRQLESEYLQARDRDAIRRLLESEIGLQQLRAEAARYGVNVQDVERGYCQQRDGTVNLDQLTDRASQWLRR